jgi:hypothetical protein
MCGLALCDEDGFEVVILDNLSCLAPTTDENDPLAWTAKLLNFTLALRRRGVSVNFRTTRRAQRFDARTF